MDAAERGRALAAEGRRLLDVAVADLEADVPTCPGWHAADLLAHVAGGWEAFHSIVDAASTEAPDFGSFAATPEDHRELATFATERLERLVAAVSAADPQQPVWTWNGVKTMDFYQRRAHLEAVIHRVDAERAAGVASPVEPTVAIDGVDELFSEFFSGRTGDLPYGSFHLHQTDGDGEFMLDVVDGVLTVSHEHAKGDAALRAAGEELLLVMWGRRGLDGLELFGDRAVAEQWIALAP